MDRTLIILSQDTLLFNKKLQFSLGFFKIFNMIFIPLRTACRKTMTDTMNSCMAFPEPASHFSHFMTGSRKIEAAARVLVPGAAAVIAFFLQKMRRSCRDQALPTEPNSSIFSFTVALMASKPGASSFRGS